MAEYIEREAARTLFAGYGSTDQFDALLDTIPAADVVEVVRCGQCFYSAHEGDLWICVHPDQYCDCGAKIVNPGYFCSYGRRREDCE